MMLLFLFAFVLCCDGAQDTWSHEVVLDGDSAVHLAWVIKDKYVTFDLTVAALGYVALGFSPNGGMRGSDIMMAWVTDDGGVQFYDMYATGNVAPKPDDSQDYELITGRQNSSHTIIRFRRKLVTCDADHDYDLGDDTIRLIWAHSNEDPKNIGSLQWHRNARGTKSVFLMSSQQYIPRNLNTDKYQHWDVLSNQVQISSEKQTLYWCTVVKAPLVTKKHHIVASVPVITKGNEAFVHHMVLFECHHPEGHVFEQYLENGGHECHSANMPADYRRCITASAGWAVGSEGDLFTEKAGFPLTSTEANPTYFLLEVHYDNPMLKKDVVDYSGLRLYYTDELREYDAGTFIAGLHVQPTHIIPPNQSSYNSVGVCSAECTSTGIPPEGIKVFQVFPHSHLAGAAVRVRHFRNERELPTIIEDNHYDFNYQQTRSLIPEVTILPGDEILVECDYKTESRQNITYGGLGTTDEMCIAYMSVYPPASLSLCSSTASYKVFEEIVGAEIKDPVNTFATLLGDMEALNDVEKRTNALQGIEFDSPEELNLYQYLKNIRWSSEVVKTFQEAMANGPINALCTNSTLGLPVDPTKLIENPAGLYGPRKQNKKASQCTMGNNVKKLYAHKKSKLYTKLKNKFN